MKFSEWVDFNKGLYTGDIIVKVISYNYALGNGAPAEIVLKAKCNMEIASDYWGALEIKKVGLAEEDDYTMLCVILIYK